MKSLPKLVKIHWENGDVQLATPVGETAETYSFDYLRDNCFWAWKEHCEIVEL
jgi:hypothetical protein